MRSILHASDYHLGAKFTAYPPSYRILLENYQKACFTYLVDYALEHQVDAVLFAGDFFDDSHPKKELLHFVKDELFRLEQAEIPFILALGNHDAHLKRELLASPTTHILSSEKMEMLSFSNWTLYGMSHERVWDQRRPFDHLPNKRSGFTLGLFHSVVGSKEVEPYLPLNLEEIENMSFDYLALGHVHRPLQLATHVPAFYSGALCGTLQEQGGFYHYRFNEKLPKRISSPPFPIEKVVLRIEDLQKDLLQIEKKAKERPLYVFLEGVLHPKEKLMLEHWKKSQEFLLEDHTYLLMEGDLPPLLESCRLYLEKEMDQLLNLQYLGWSREEAKEYFEKRREDLFEELLALYLGDAHD